MTLLLSPALGLTACLRANDPADAGTRWVSIAAVSLLLLDYLGLVIYLWRTGKLSLWFKAGSTTARLRTQDARLKSELKGLDRDKAALLDELGEKAWEARVCTPSYENTYNQLMTIQGQMDGAEAYRR